MSIDITQFKVLKSYARVMAVATTYQSRSRARLAEDGKDFIEIAIFLTEIKETFPDFSAWWELTNLLPDLEEYFYGKVLQDAIAVGEALFARADFEKIRDAGFSKTALVIISRQDQEIVDELIKEEMTAPDDEKPSQLSCNQLREKIARLKSRRRIEDDGDSGGAPEDGDDQNEEDEPERVEIPPELCSKLKEIYAAFCDLWVQHLDPFVNNTKSLSESEMKDLLLVVYEYFAAIETQQSWIHEQCSRAFEDYRNLEDVPSEKRLRDFELAMDRLSPFIKGAV